MSRTTPSCCHSRHRPGRLQWEAGGITRARCRSCGMNLMRLALSRRWIIADQLGGGGVDQAERAQPVDRAVAHH